MLTIAATAALVRSDISRVVVHNDSGLPIGNLGVEAAGSSRTFLNVNDGESVALQLAKSGGESAVTITTNGSVMWQGDYIEPRGGYLEMVHLRPDGGVITSSTISFWQKLLH